mmetsp:Transcript_17194/g.47195  ORF Transcript_17194/g.47195 Transcript_17194/m.47195 type:complete len:97 (+) Transcript_17194:2172-2462(+)
MSVGSAPEASNPLSTAVDIEGAELQAFLDFPFDEYRVKVMTIERPKPELRAKLASVGFRFVRRIGYDLDVLYAHESLPGVDDLVSLWWNDCMGFCD